MQAVPFNSKEHMLGTYCCAFQFGGFKPCSLKNHFCTVRKRNFHIDNACTSVNDVVHLSPCVLVSHAQGLQNRRRSSSILGKQPEQKHFTANEVPARSASYFLSQHYG